MNPSYSIAQGEGQYLITTDGRRLFDLISGFGSVFLGHCDPAITAAAHLQIDQLWNVARLPSVFAELAQTRVASILESHFDNLFLYSTGMESIEFGLRLATSKTGKKQFIGFKNSMYGKSVATSNLGWDNSVIRCDGFSRMDFPTEHNQDQVLARLRLQLRTGQVAAILLEPIQASWQGDQVPDKFVEQAFEMCRQNEALFILDETLTGLYRTGPRFYFESASFRPDILVFAKSIGNGFPVSVVASSIGEPYASAALPGSTFSGSPLACRIVDETLKQSLSRVSVSQIEEIGRIVTTAFSQASGGDFHLRGRGALWVLTLGSPDQSEKLQQLALANDVLVSRVGSSIRLLPQAEVESSQLDAVCRLLAKAL